MKKIPKTKDVLDNGWQLEWNFLLDIERSQKEDFSTGLEEIEGIVLLLIEKGYCELE